MSRRPTAETPRRGIALEVDYVPRRRKSDREARAGASATRSVHPHAKVRSAVSQCAQVMEHIIVSVANRVEVQCRRKDEADATHHAPIMWSSHVELTLNLPAAVSIDDGRGGRLSTFEPVRTASRDHDSAHRGGRHGCRAATPRLTTRAASHE